MSAPSAVSVLPERPTEYPADKDDLVVGMNPKTVAALTKYDMDDLAKLGQRTAIPPLTTWDDDLAEVPIRLTP